MGYNLMFSASGAPVLFKSLVAMLILQNEIMDFFFFSSRYCHIKSPMKQLFLRLEKSYISSLCTTLLVSTTQAVERKIRTCKITLIGVLTEKECPRKGAAYMVFHAQSGSNYYHSAWHPADTEAQV